MNNTVVSELGDDDLLGFLEERNAPILSYDTTQLGELFGQSFHGYSMLHREFKESSFGVDFYTDQHQFPSMAYAENRHLAVTPKGAGKAADLLHMHLRLLGIRIANVFRGEAKRLIGDEAMIREFSEQTREGIRKVIKDKPPSFEARKILEEATIFNVALTNQNGEEYVVPIVNKQVQQYQNAPFYSALESALALREQSIEINGSRSRETFSWVRDLVSLQSVETMVQLAQIIERGIQEKYHDLSLSDFNLTVPMKDRITYSRAVFERAHECRRDYALSNIIAKRTGLRKAPTALSLLSVGESPKGFSIEDPKDAASVVFVMPRALELLKYAFDENLRADIVLPADIQESFIDLANKISQCSNNAEAAEYIYDATDLITAIKTRSEAVYRMIGENLIDPESEIQSACTLLRTMMEKHL